jgi:hypothetical protein
MKGEKKQRCAATVECSISPDEKERACLQKDKQRGLEEDL